MLALIGSAPLARMAYFLGSPLTPELLDKLVTAATASAFTHKKYSQMGQNGRESGHFMR